MSDATSAVSYLVVTIIGLGMGAATTMQDFKQAFYNPSAIAIGLASQYVFMPLVALALTRMFDLNQLYTVGVILTGCSPGGSASNIFTYWSKGNVALSITMSFLSSAAAFAMMPLLILLLIQTAENIRLEIPWAVIFITVALTIGPCILGFALRHYNREYKLFGRFLWQWVELITSVVGLIFFFVIVIGAIYLYGATFQRAPVSLWICAVILEPAGFGFGYVTAWLLSQTRKDCRTIALETGVQNLVIALAIIALSYEGQDREDVLVFPLMYGFLYLIHSAYLVLFLRLAVASYDTDLVEIGSPAAAPVATTEESIPSENVELMPLDMNAIKDIEKAKCAELQSGSQAEESEYKSQSDVEEQLLTSALSLPNQL